MHDKRLIKVSKYLSRHLRHEPERLRLRIQPGGWVDVDELLRQCAQQSFAITPEELQEVVERNDKRRFSFDSTGSRIRANQGHSIEIDLQLSPATPPAVLYHGTASHCIGQILTQGLSPMGRHHVHLSEDSVTALRVGRRHGRPVVFEIAADAMHLAGHSFYVTDNRVWLTASVPPAYLMMNDPES